MQRGRSSSPLVILSEAKNLVVTAKILRFAQNDKLLRYFRRAALRHKVTQGIKRRHCLRIPLCLGGEFC
jgi:hypothetical protein